MGGPMEIMQDRMKVEEKNISLLRYLEMNILQSGITGKVEV